MPRPAIYTPEEAKKRRLAHVRKSVAAHKDRQRAMTRLEQAVWKSRASLGEDYVPYTPEEAEAVARLKARIAGVEAEAAALNTRIRECLEAEISADPRLAPLLSELINGRDVQVMLKPF